MNETKLIDKLAWIYIKDGKILSTRSKGKDTYYIPGGKRESGESDWDALSREINEELSVQLIKSSAKAAGVFEAHAHGKDQDIVVRMTCYTAEFDGELVADSEIDEIRWFSYEEGRPLSSEVDKLIFDSLHQSGSLK